MTRAPSDRPASGRDAVLPGTVTLGREVDIGVRALFVEGEATIVGDGVRVGAGAIVGAGLRIGRGAVIRPGAVVLSPVPPNAIVEGNPARVVGYAATGPLEGTRRIAPAEAEGAAVQPLGVGGAALHRMHDVRDLRGALTVGEIDKDLPFPPARYFVVYDVPSEELRGEHAHRRCAQFLICVHGSCRLLLDDGTDRCEVLLDRPSLGVHMPPMVWGTQYRYSADAVLLVFASHLYDPDDYLRTYDAFLAALAETGR